MLHTKTLDVEFKRTTSGAYAVWVDNVHSGYFISKTGSREWKVSYAGYQPIGYYRTLSEAKSDLINIL